MRSRYVSFSHPTLFSRQQNATHFFQKARLETQVREGEDDETKEKALEELYKVMAEIAALNKEQKIIENKLGPGVNFISNAGTDFQSNKMLLCRISGNILSNVSSVHRLNSHFRGKQFNGWKQIREKYAELKEKNPPRGIPGYGPNGGESSSSRSRDDDRHHRRRRDDDYSYSSRDRRRRSRSRSRERGYRRRRY